MKYYFGQTATFSKTITEYDVYAFAGITGDFNSVHVNKIYAENSVFHKQISHGMLVASFISTVLGTYLPGPGTVYLKQTVQFVKPVFIGDTITAKVEITEIDLEKNRAVLKTIVINQSNDVVVDGEALVLLPFEK